MLFRDEVQKLGIHAGVLGKIAVVKNRVRGVKDSGIQGMPLLRDVFPFCQHGIKLVQE